MYYRLLPGLAASAYVAVLVVSVRTINRLRRSKQYMHHMSSTLRHTLDIH